MSRRGLLDLEDMAGLQVISFGQDGTLRQDAIELIGSN